MANWFDKWMMGNPNKPDFTVEDLPQTRMELFFDVIKIRFLKLISVNLLYMLFLLPLILAGLFTGFSVYSQVEAEKLDNIQAIAELLLKTVDVMLLIGIPLYMLAAPAKAGMHYVIRNWAWGEDATIRHEFWKEFKRSWKQAVTLHFITGLGIYAVFWWIRLLITPQNIENFPWMPYAAALIGFLLVLYLLSSMHHFPQLVTYNLTVRQIIKNSFIYMILQLPRTFVALVGYVAIFALCAWLPAIFVVLLLTMGIAFITLAKTIFSGFIFDKYVNKDPEKMRRGMAPLKSGKK